MPRAEKKYYKAIYFDLFIKELEIHYSKTNPKGAYGVIMRFMNNHNFSHAQFSGYHSNYQTTDANIFDIVGEMNQKFEWLKYCINHIEVTNIGENYDLSVLFNVEEEF